LIDLEELRAFVAVTETGSLLAAATSLDVSRTTLRRRVEDLEARAGVPLFARTAKGVVPTAAGLVLAQRGKQMIQEAAVLLDAIREVGTSPSGPLRVLLPVGMPPHAIVPWLRSLRRRFPRLLLHVRFVDDPLEHLNSGVDLAIHFGPEPEGPWTSRELKRLREWLLASREYLRERGAPRSLDDLAAHAICCWEAPGRRDDPRALPLLRGGHVPVEPALVATDIHMLRQCASTGLGIALVPDAMLPDPGSAAAKLVPVLPDIVGRERVLRLTVPRGLADSPKIQAVLDHTMRRWSREPAAGG
jgi:DNA-binding transcriptional LysR family regulator